VFQYFSVAAPQIKRRTLWGAAVELFSLHNVVFVFFFVPLAVALFFIRFIFNPLFLLSLGHSPILYVVFRTVPWGLCCIRARPVPTLKFTN
jgi:hypothetical protein